jgi:Leucine-rich repeat (LRR) protein
MHTKTFYQIILLILICLTNLKGQHNIYKTSAPAMSYTSLTEALQKQEQVFALNLSNQNLRQFPAEILQFPNLRYLNLSGNPITDIPSQIGNMPYLETLILPKEISPDLVLQSGHLPSISKTCADYVVQGKTTQAVIFFEKSLLQIDFKQHISMMQQKEKISLLLWGASLYNNSGNRQRSLAILQTALQTAQGLNMEKYALTSISDMLQNREATVSLKDSVNKLQKLAEGFQSQLNQEKKSKARAIYLIKDEQKNVERQIKNQELLKIELLKKDTKIQKIKSNQTNNILMLIGCCIGLLFWITYQNKLKLKKMQNKLNAYRNENTQQYKELLELNHKIKNIEAQDNKKA